MKYSIFGKWIALFAVAVLTFTGWKDDDNTPADTGNVTFSIANEIGGQPIQLGQLIYTNAAGNQYRVDMMKYYLSNFTLIKDDSTEYAIGNHELVDITVPASCDIVANDIPNGTYTKVRFNLGIDSLYNHSGDQAGDLDPINGMIWSWNTGYIFFKHEGAYKDSLNQTQGLLFHYGTDKALSTVEITIHALVINGNNKKVNLVFNLNALYAAPNQIDFNVNNVHQSTSPSDTQWILKMKQNFTQAFSFKSIE
jgi:hypothetical protein